MQDILRILEDNHQKYKLVSRAHHISASAYSRYNLYLGVPVILLSTLVGTAIFAALQNNPDQALKILTGITSVLAALLSALQTFLGFNEKSSLHKTAAIKYAALGREFSLLELKIAGNDSFDRPKAIAELEAILHKIAKLAEESPTIQDRFYGAADKEFAITQAAGSNK